MNAKEANVMSKERDLLASFSVGMANVHSPRGNTIPNVSPKTSPQRFPLFSFTLKGENREDLTSMSSSNGLPNREVVGDFAEFIMNGNRYNRRNLIISDRKFLRRKIITYM